MARPIEPTPILKGKDAENFLRDLQSAKLSPKVYNNLEQCERLYDKFYSKIDRHAGRSI